MNFNTITKGSSINETVY